MLTIKHIPYIVTIFFINKHKLKELFVFYLIVVISDMQIMYKKIIINYLFLYFVNSYDFIEYVKSLLFISLFSDKLQSIYVLMALSYYFYNNLFLSTLNYYKSIAALTSIICNVRHNITFMFILKIYMIFKFEKFITLRNYIILLEVVHNISNCLFLLSY